MNTKHKTYYFDEKDKWKDNLLITNY